jgi:hypothetical protein
MTPQTQAWTGTWWDTRRGGEGVRDKERWMARHKNATSGIFLTLVYPKRTAGRAGCLRF